MGVEHIDALVEMGKRNTGKSAEGRGLMESGVVEYRKADGRLGVPEEAPFDAIHVGAAAAGHQQALIEQLRAPGR